MRRRVAPPVLGFLCFVFPALTAGLIYAAPPGLGFGEASYCTPVPRSIFESKRGPSSQKALARDDNEKVEAGSEATATARQRLPPFAKGAKDGPPGKSNF